MTTLPPASSTNLTNFSAVPTLLLGLLVVDLGQAEQAFALAVDGDGNVFVRVAEFVANLGVDRGVKRFAEKHGGSSRGEEGRKHCMISVGTMAQPPPGDPWGPP